MPVTIFFCYARKDQALLHELKAHLRPLQRQGLIEVWDDGNISAGAEWEQEISKHLNAAQIILLLVSPGFMNSDYCYSIEMKRAVERHERKEARVIPVILDHVYWQVDPLNKLQALPTDGKPVMSKSWHNLNEAFLNVTEGIYKVVEQLTEKHASVLPIVAEATPPKVAQASSIAPITEPARNVSPRIENRISTKEIVQSLKNVPDLASGATQNFSKLKPAPDIGHDSESNTALSIPGNTSELYTLIRTLRGYLPVNRGRCMAFSPNGQFLATGDSNYGVRVRQSEHPVRLWEVSTGKDVLHFEGHVDRVGCLAFSPDGQFLASGSSDYGVRVRHSIRLWEVSTGKDVRSLKGHSVGIDCVAFSPDGQFLASGSSSYYGNVDEKLDCSIRLWEVSTGKVVRNLKEHPDDVNCVVFSPDGQFLASGGSNHSISLWEVSTGKNVHNFKGHVGRVFCLAFSPDGQFLASGSFDQTISLWEVSTGKNVHSFKGHIDRIYSIAFSPDGQFLASGCGDLSGRGPEPPDDDIKLWEVSTGKNVHTLEGHVGWVCSVAFSPDGRLLASGTKAAVQLWRIS